MVECVQALFANQLFLLQQNKVLSSLSLEPLHQQKLFGGLGSF